MTPDWKFAVAIPGNASGFREFATLVSESGKGNLIIISYVFATINIDENVEKCSRGL